MTTPELPEVLRDYLKALPPDALLRVVEAAPWEWGTGSYEDAGRRCLAGIAEDRRWNGRDWDTDIATVRVVNRAAPTAYSEVARVFDLTCQLRGLDAARSAVQAEARRLLGK